MEDSVGIDSKVATDGSIIEYKSRIVNFFIQRESSMTILLLGFMDSNRQREFTMVLLLLNDSLRMKELT